MGTLAVIGFALALALPATSADRNVVEELSRLEDVWNDAHLKGDTESLERLWADEVVVIVPKMRPFTRSEALGLLRSGRMRFERYSSSEIKIQVHDGSAVVTGRLRRSRATGERVLEDDWRFTKVYVRRGGAWRVVAFHASDTGD